ncbi:glycoside hydrolase family 128 protein [Annulohypoxylon moriforme]|nr:glycoside hydrolase family 128 protein [Annulohypoxylon moriforme]
MVIKKRQILWDWTNSAGPGNPGVPDKINQVPFGNNSPVASVVNWNAWVPPELKDRAPFRPMVRVLQSTTGNDWATIENSKYPIILFFNEPERAGITPEQAKDIWYKQMLPLRKNKGKKLGSPAVASDDNGHKWIEKFMSLMVTEIASIDRNYQAVLSFTVQVCNWMDNQEWIFEYGLFDFQRKVADSFVSPAAQLMDANGNFTELGKIYVNQQPMKVPGKSNIAEKAFSAASVDEGNARTGEPVSHETSNAAFQVTETATSDKNEFSASTALSGDQQKALDAHNNKRKSKGLHPLSWDNQLAKNAEDYAKHLAKIGKLEHSSGDQRPNQGENLAWASSSNTPLAMAANMWIDEEKNYHGEPIGQGNFGSYGHYTQCMWKSTTKLGMGSAKDAKGGVYTVGRYSPPGNIVGQKPY